MGENRLKWFSPPTPQKCAPKNTRGEKGPIELLGVKRPLKRRCPIGNKVNLRRRYPGNPRR